MKRPFPILAAGIMASLSIMAGIGVVHAQETAEARPGGRVAPNGSRWRSACPALSICPGTRRKSSSPTRRVANAVVRSPRKLYVIGMDTGQTSVVALDQQGSEIGHLELSIRRDIGVGELQQILRTAMPTAAITARTVNDTIILTGAVDSIEDAQRAGDIAKGFVAAGLWRRVPPARRARAQGERRARRPRARMAGSSMCSPYAAAIR